MPIDDRLHWIDALPLSGDWREGLAAEQLAELDRDPRLGAIAARVHALDQCIAGALESVPLPVGLEARLLASLATLPAVIEDHEPIAMPARTKRLRVSRRRALFAASVATAAALVLYFGFSSSEQIWNAEAIANLARDNFHGEPSDGQLVTLVAPPRAFPLSAALAALPDARWRELPDFLGRSGVIYELKRGDIRARLYVVKLRGGPRDARLEEKSIAGSPRPASTAGSTTAVWREQGLLYVLVVEGGEGEYRQFLAPSPVVA